MDALKLSRPEKKPLSLFDLPTNFFDSSSLLLPNGSSTHASIPSSSLVATSDDALNTAETRGRGDPSRAESKGKESSSSRWTCNTCRAEFESLLDQRSHFKSDLHRLNVKLSIAGKKCVKEEDFEGLETDNNSFLETLEVSSISGSEDESEEEESVPDQKLARKNRDLFKQKLYLHLNSGEKVSVWRCLLLDESEEISQSSDGNKPEQNDATNSIGQNEPINRLKQLISEPRDKTCLRIVLLASGGHFAGCVFDGKSILAHKTFHRYVVRAKAGKKQSSQDATGKVAHSAGSSIRRHNEAALKREVQELFVSWKQYFDMCKCILMHAPSRNRRMIFDGGKIQSIFQGCMVRNVPLTVRRPTFKEAKRVYNHLSQVNFETEEDAVHSGDNEGIIEELKEKKEEEKLEEIVGNEIKETCSVSSSGEECPPDADVITDQTSQLLQNETTPLHLAAKSGDAAGTFELLEQGLNPCIKDERGKTPYMLAADKEVRNAFRRFMALNLDKWDWHAANVPSPLTKEMEESQAAKQAEKDAKRKAKAKELKKLKKAKEKEKEKTKAQESVSQKVPAEASKGQLSGSVPATMQKQPLNPWKPPGLLSEEERQRQLAEEREKRAAAAERRMAALNLQSRCQTTIPSSRSDPNNGASDVTCAYCHSSLSGKVPFHRYNYKYCSPTCMHVHGETLEVD